MELPITPSKQQQQQQQTSFCFPILKNSVILQCMSELGYDLNERELLEPQKYRDRVRSIFRELVCLAWWMDSWYNSLCIFSFLDGSNDFSFILLHIMTHLGKTTSWLVRRRSVNSIKSFRWNTKHQTLLRSTWWISDWNNILSIGCKAYDYLWDTWFRTKGSHQSYCEAP